MKNHAIYNWCIKYDCIERRKIEACRYSKLCLVYIPFRYWRLTVSIYSTVCCPFEKNVNIYLPRMIDKCAYICVSVWSNKWKKREREREKRRKFARSVIPNEVVVSFSTFDLETKSIYLFFQFIWSWFFFLEKGRVV